MDFSDRGQLIRRFHVHISDVTKKKEKKKNVVTIAKEKRQHYDPRMYIYISRISHKQCFKVE